MEGTTINSTKLKFVENKTKIRLANVQGNLSNSYKPITAACNHNTVLVGLPDSTIRSIPFNDFGQPRNGRIEANILFQVRAAPRLLTVARYGNSSVLLVCSNCNNNPTVECFDLDTSQKIGELQLTEISGCDIVDYAWHPNYFDSLVALCTNSGHLLVVAISKKNRGISLVYNKLYGTMSCCWSPKGKNLAIGTVNGGVLRLEPIISADSFNFKEVDKSNLNFNHPRMTPDHKIIKLRWINKTYLMSVHARINHPGGPDAIHSIFTIKPSKPYRYWSNLCFENQISKDYVVHLVNLSNSVICSSNSSGEASVIGFDGAKEASTGELNDWHSLILDEGSRIELPLDENNQEASAAGATVTRGDNPNLIFLTSDGTLCSYIVMHPENILRTPENQPELQLPIQVQSSPQNHIQQTSTFQASPQIQPLSLIKPSPSQPFSSLLTQSPLTQTSSPRVDALSLNKSSLQLSPAQSFSQLSKSIDQTPTVQQAVASPAQKEPVIIPLVKIDLSKELESIRKGVDSCKAAMKQFQQVNQMRIKFEEIIESHQSARDALDFFKDDIHELELGALENFALIEYAKMRQKTCSRKRSIDPVTTKKMESIKTKSRTMAEQLSNLEINVEVAWEDLVRKKKIEKPRHNPTRSLEMIYKNLATNQKIISHLKKKLSENVVNKKLTEVRPADMVEATIARKELDPSRMVAFKKFLSSRNIAPVRT